MSESPLVTDRLDSWKEIASYLGRNERTVIRWEKLNGLPVHRIPGGQRKAVFAFREELDAWLTGADGETPTAQTPVNSHGLNGIATGGPTQVEPKAASEDAAHFLVRMVHKYPHEVTIYAAGPMTNIATAILVDPEFASLAQELVIMGGSINPHTDDPEYLDSPRHEFNLWFDPEASSIMLHARWAKISVTTVDVSIETHLTAEMLAEIGRSHEPAAQYIVRYTRKPGDYLWDELAAAAWLDPSLITRERYVFVDVSLDKGISYGDTLVWTEHDKPSISLQKAHVQMDVDWPKFQKMFVQLMSAPTPKAHDPQMLHPSPGESKQ